MRVFVTGATGHIGACVVRELQGAGHQVSGLARSERSAAALVAAGVAAVRGGVDDLAVLQAAAAAADGVIHLAFQHDLAFSGGFAEAAANELRAVEAMGEALAGSGKPLIGTSGTLTLAFGGLGRLGTEADVVAGGPRCDAENAVIALARRGVRAAVVRLAPTVHSDLDHHGFVPTLVGLARRGGQAVYLGEGANRWPAVHTLDAARLYRLALEAAPAGTRLHGAAEEGIPFRAIAEAIGRGLGVPARSVPAEDAARHLGFLAPFASADNPTSSALTRKVVGWQPGQPGLLADLAARHYFDERP